MLEPADLVEAAETTAVEAELTDAMAVEDETEALEWKELDGDRWENLVTEEDAADPDALQEDEETDPDLDEFHDALEPGDLEHDEELQDEGAPLDLDDEASTAEVAAVAEMNLVPDYDAAFAQMALLANAAEPVPELEAAEDSPEDGEVFADR